MAPGTPFTPLARLPRLLTALRRGWWRRRRLLAAVAVFVAVLATLSALRPPEEPVVAVTVAARDLDAGAVLGAEDLRVAEFAPGTEPEDVVTPDVAVGRMLAAPLAAGEALTAQRFVGATLATATAGLDAVPLRLPDAGAVGLLTVGDEIDLVSTDPATGESDVVATSVPVLALPGGAGADATGGHLPGRLVVVGVPRAQVAALTAAVVRRYVTYTWPNR